MDVNKSRIPAVVSIVNLIVCLVALLVVAALSIAVARFAISVREFLIFLFGIVALAAVTMPSDTLLRVGLKAEITTVGLG